MTDFLKTSAPRKCQPLIVLPYFVKKPGLCIASILNHYIKITASLRNTHDFLLLTFKKPHRPASSQTVSKRIKKGLTLAGLNTALFKSHSTRHTSSSNAIRQGLSIETIRRMAGWSEKSNTFNTFYNRPVLPKSDFARALLSN